MPGPAPHLAVIAQDLDSMGRFLSGETVGTRRRDKVTESGHRAVSDRLSALAQETIRLLDSEEYFGVPVYAGATTCWLSPQRCTR
ncbi:Cas10/Cmr2 second palm domain-containing protein [Streptomyces sp. INA 01156]